MKPKYTKHALDQIRVRVIPKRIVKDIYFNPDFYCLDAFEENYVAIKKIEFKNRLRYIALSFNHETDHDKIVTVKPEKRNNLFNKIKKGRWIRL